MERTNPEWPCTWFTPRLTGKGGTNAGSGSCVVGGMTQPATSGVDTTGAGGGGHEDGDAYGNGGSGVVVIRYALGGEPVPGCG